MASIPEARLGPLHAPRPPMLVLNLLRPGAGGSYVQGVIGLTGEVRVVFFVAIG